MRCRRCSPPTHASPRLPRRGCNPMHQRQQAYASGLRLTLGIGASPIPPRRNCSWPAAPRPPRPAAACTLCPRTRGAADPARPARRVHPARRVQPARRVHPARRVQPARLAVAGAAAAPPKGLLLRGWRAAASSAAATPCGRGRTTGRTRGPLASVAGSAHQELARAARGLCRQPERGIRGARAGACRRVQARAGACRHVCTRMRRSGRGGTHVQPSMKAAAALADLGAQLICPPVVH